MTRVRNTVALHELQIRLLLNRCNINVISHYGDAGFIVRSDQDPFHSGACAM